MLVSEGLDVVVQAVWVLTELPMTLPVVLHSVLVHVVESGEHPLKPSARAATAFCAVDGE